MRQSNAVLNDTITRLHRNYLDILRRRVSELRKFAERCRNGDVTALDCEEIRLRVHNLAGSGSIYGYINVSEAARPLDHALTKNTDRKTLAKLAFELITACELTLAGAETAPYNEKLARFKIPARQSHGPFPILLTVDDDPAIHDLVQAMFRDHVRIVSAYNSDEAMTAAHRHCPDLILLDNLMPGSDGLAFLEKLGSDHDIPPIPVIMLSAEDRPQEIMRATIAGVTDYIAKPFDPHVLVDRISSMLKRTRTTVLVANDDAAMRNLICVKLRHQGFHVMETGDGNKALQLALEYGPELIVLHQSIAGLGGAELLHALREDKRTRFTPIFYLASNAHGETMLETINSEAGDDNVIPFVPEKVTTHVLHALGLETATA